MTKRTNRFPAWVKFFHPWKNGRWSFSILVDTNSLYHIKREDQDLPRTPFKKGKTTTNLSKKNNDPFKILTCNKHDKLLTNQ